MSHPLNRKEEFIISGLRFLRLPTFAATLDEQFKNPTKELLDRSFVDRLYDILQAELNKRSARAVEKLVKAAGFPDQQAQFDFYWGDIENRGLSAAIVNSLRDLTWMDAAMNVVIHGPSGVGKSWLAQAIGYEACKAKHRVLYFHGKTFVDSLIKARNDGTLPAFRDKCSRTDLLILDDFAMTELRDSLLTEDLLRILDDRYHRNSTILTSQADYNNWYPQLGEGYTADAIMDRLVHNAYVYRLQGKSLRERARKEMDEHLKALKEASQVGG